ncbi:hypothetical protein [Silvanigrella aquatica]|uniref:Lipoprotein n=1 Tax=Silvanigrella aquatica TaxID=1915309 RepID=A0A1L4CXI6_9BACT|nr:hypothetical protein [Silvanigrella aquatica]APJ02659.1 hypothetical protein AXG55_01410 [Silvanigrella aquatica]
MLKKSLFIAGMSIAFSAVYSCKENNKNIPKISQDDKKKSVLTTRFSGVTGTPVDTPFEVNGNVTCGTISLPDFKLTHSQLNITYFSDLKCSIKIKSITMDEKTYNVETDNPLSLNIVDNKIVSSAQNVKFTSDSKEIYFNAETVNGASAIYHMTAEIGAGKSLTDAKAAALTPNQVPNRNMNKKASIKATKQTLPYSVKKLLTTHAEVKSTSSFEISRYLNNIFALEAVGSLNLASHCKVLPFPEDMNTEILPTQEQLRSIFINERTNCSERIMSSGEKFKPFYNLAQKSYLIVTLEGTSYFAYKTLRHVTQTEVDAAKALLLKDGTLAMAVETAQKEYDTVANDLFLTEEETDAFNRLNDELKAKDGKLKLAQSALESAQQTAQELQEALAELTANIPAAPEKTKPSEEPPQPKPISLRVLDLTKGTLEKESKFTFNPTKVGNNYHISYSPKAEHSGEILDVENKCKIVVLYNKNNYEDTTQDTLKNAFENHDVNFPCGEQITLGNSEIPFDDLTDKGSVVIITEETFNINGKDKTYYFATQIFGA